MDTTLAPAQASLKRSLAVQRGGKIQSFLWVAAPLTLGFFLGLLYRTPAEPLNEKLPVTDQALSQAENDVIKAELERTRLQLQDYEVRLKEHEKTLQLLVEELTKLPKPTTGSNKSKKGGLGGAYDGRSAYFYHSNLSVNVNPNVLGKLLKSGSGISATELRSFLAYLPLGYPVRADLSSRFGMRASPFTGEPQFHAGLDFSADPNTIVHATASGRVVEAGWKGAYGYCIVVDHGGGVSTLYGHLNAFKVRLGQRVRRGMKIGTVGNTGNSTGPHLHYEVRHGGIPQNPISFVAIADAWLSRLRVVASPSAS